jgi:hypothetical protein
MDPDEAWHTTQWIFVDLLRPAAIFDPRLCDTVESGDEYSRYLPTPITSSTESVQFMMGRFQGSQNLELRLSQGYGTAGDCKGQLSDETVDQRKVTNKFRSSSLYRALSVLG